MPDARISGLCPLSSDLCQVGCPIRKSPDQSLFPAPRSLSQGIASFIASCCQGIHQTPFSRLIPIRKAQDGFSIVRQRRTLAGLFPLKLALSGSPAGAVERRLKASRIKNHPRSSDRTSLTIPPPGSWSGMHNPPHRKRPAGLGQCFRLGKTASSVLPSGALLEDD